MARKCTRQSSASRAGVLPALTRFAGGLLQVHGHYPVRPHHRPDRGCRRPLHGCAHHSRTSGRGPASLRLLALVLRCPLALLSRRAGCAGLVPNLAGIIPEKALKLGINDILRELYADDNGDVSLARGILIGACAGLGQCIATNPMEIVKIRGQTAALNGEAFNMAETVREMGLRGLYRGAASTLFRDIPFSAAFFASYGVLKDECAAPCPPLALPSAPVLVNSPLLPVLRVVTLWI